METIAGTEAASKAQRCAARLLTLAPQLMQTLRVEMRAGRPQELTVPQFRCLVFFQIHPGAALSQAAEHLGLGLPSASKLAESLVSRGLLVREHSARDRRRTVIALTPRGEGVLASAREAATAVFTRRLSGLTEVELEVLHSVLGLLARVAALDYRPAAPPQPPGAVDPETLDLDPAKG